MKIKKPQIIDTNKKTLAINLVLSLVIFIVILFIGLSINFILTRLMPGDPVLAYLPQGPPNPVLYEYWYNYLWFDRPIIIQYFRYLSDLFLGNWGYSSSINFGQDVWSLIMEKFFRTIDLLWIPIILGVILGTLLGKISLKFRKTWIDKLIQFFTVIGISITIFSGGIWLLKFLAYDLGWFPKTGFKTAEYGDPNFVTGSRIIDALISGEFYYIPDYINHLILPVFCLSIATISFITLVTRSNLKKKQEKSIFSNSIITLLSFGLILSFSFIVETTFNLKGIGKLTLDAIRESDYFVARTLIYIFILFMIIFTLISNIFFSVQQSSKFSWRDESEDESIIIDKNNNDQPKEEKYPDVKRKLRKYISYIPRYLFIAISLIIIIYIVILASFPQLISGFSFEEANGIFSENFYPPSANHLLGQGKFGRDVFARILYGTKDAFIVGLSAIFIGLLGGVPLGFVSSLHKYANRAVEAFLILFFIIPIIAFLAIIIAITGLFYFVIIFALGNFLIPIFALIFATYPINKRNIIISLKKTVIYIPLILGCTILIYESLAFLGFRDPSSIVIGGDIYEARLFVQTAPWASLWPGFYLFLFLFGVFLFYYGLKNFFADSLDLERELKTEM